MKTTLRQLIQGAKNKLNTKCKFTDVADPSKLAEEFGFYDIYWDDEKRLRDSYFQVWYCTDQWVGGKVYFLEGEEVAISFKSARKDDEQIRFLSEEAKDKVLKYLLSLRQDYIPSVAILNESELDEEIEDWYSVEYAEQIMHKTAWYYNPELEKDEEVEILEKASYNRNNHLPDKFHSVKVKFLERNIEMIVDCRELKLKYNQI